MCVFAKDQGDEISPKSKTKATREKGRVGNEVRVDLSLSALVGALALALAQIDQHFSKTFAIISRHNNNCTVQTPN